MAFFFSSTQGFMRAKQVLYHFNHSTSPIFVLGIFEIGSLKLFAQAGLELHSS
jgi:hypothetical protein